MQAGVDGLLKDKTRPSRKPPLSKETVARVVKLTQGPPPGETTHWTSPAMGKAAGISGATDLALSRASAAPSPAVQTERPKIH